jgi:hypothetical protein
MSSAPELLPELYLAMIENDVLIGQLNVPDQRLFTSPGLSFFFRSRLLALQS